MVGRNADAGYCAASDLQLQGDSLSLLDMQHELLRIAGKKYLRFWPHYEIYENVSITHLPTLRRQPAWSFLMSFLIWAYVHRIRCWWQSGGDQ